MRGNPALSMRTGLTALLSFVLLSGAAPAGIGAPDFNPDGDTGWLIDRAAGDVFQPPDSGPGPVQPAEGYVYRTNAEGGQPTYLLADVNNPILKPWAAAEVKKNNDAVTAGKVPFVPRERCWPGGVPGMDIYSLGRSPLHFIQTAKEIVVTNELYAFSRHIYLNVPHSKNPKPSFHGESIGHYEGDELVVDTIGLNDKTYIDNFRTPHTGQLHVIERFRLMNGGKTLQVLVHVEDPGAFNTPWNAKQTWRRDGTGPLIENICEPTNDFYFGYDVPPIPQTKTADF